MSRLNLLLWTVAYLAIVTGTAAQNRYLTITVKSTLYDLYIDGVRQNNLTHANDWTTPDVVPLTSNNRLISLMAIDSTETCAGVIASVTDDFFVTDIDWKCTYFVDTQWYKLGSEDDSWPAAYPVGPNGNVTWPDACQRELIEIPSISPNAYWIWTDTIPATPFYHQTIYCRGYLPTCELESPCDNGGTCNKNNETVCTCLVGYIGDYCETVDLKYLSLTAKETLYAAYVDGIPIPLQNGDNWEQTDSLSVNSISRLLAVMAIQLEGTCPGILGGVTDNEGDYLLTNATWKCSSTAAAGWAALGYDDSTWQPAALVRRNDNANGTQCDNELSEISSISSDAYWIWTTNPGGQDVVAFCRGYLPICGVHPCKNGGTCNVNMVALCTCPGNYTGKYCETKISNSETVSSDDAPQVASGQKLNDGDRPTDIAGSNQALRPIQLPAPSLFPDPNQKSDNIGQRKAFEKDRQHVDG